MSQLVQLRFLQTSNLFLYFSNPFPEGHFWPLPQHADAEGSRFRGLGNVRVLVQVEPWGFANRQGSVFPRQNRHTSPSQNTFPRPPVHCLLTRVQVQTAWVLMPTPP